MFSSLSNRINNGIFVTNHTSPIIVPFGPAYSGKTMMLNRLFQYLRSHGFVVKLNLQFINSPYYLNACKDYETDMMNHGIPIATNMPILGDIINHNGMCEYQFLDMPGQYLFDYDNLKAPSLLHEIIFCPNKKIWLILIDLDCNVSHGSKMEYVKRIAYLKHHMTPNDKMIIVVNKIDALQTNVQSTGTLQMLGNMINQQYPDLLEIFKVRGIKRLWKPYNYTLVPFSCGVFSFTSDGTPIYSTGNNMFPQRLWDAISK